MESESKRKYRELCKTNKVTPFFIKDWYLDAVAGSEWDVIILEKSGEIIFAMPYVIRKIKGFRIFTMPQLTQNVGPYIVYPEGQKYNTRISWEKKVIYEFTEKLPPADMYMFQLSHKFKNWLPFYWKNFSQTTLYTYIIPKTRNHNEISREFDNDIRRRIKRLQEKGVEVIESNNVERFYQINRKTFERKNTRIPYTLETVKRIYENGKKYNSCKILFAVKGDKEIAGGFFVKDEESYYYLMGGFTEEENGGMDIVLYTAIKNAIEEEKNFDFEGSISEDIEMYFRGFGGIQTPYFRIKKINSKLLKIGICFLEVFMNKKFLI